MKFVPVVIRPLLTNPDEITSHLNAFVDSFISSRYRERWRHILFEKPEKAYYELVKFDRHLEKKYCIMLESRETFPGFLENRIGNGPGIYYQARDPSIKIATPEAATLAGMKGEDSIFSITPGKLAIFFFHEGWAWLCQR